MATMSSAPGATTLTPPSSSHGNHSGWKPYGSSGYQDDSMQDRAFMDSLETTNGTSKTPLSSQNGASFQDPFAKQDATEPFPATKDYHAGVQPTSQPQNKRSNTDGEPIKVKDENSKWIHRDKLARIESEELQAAGITLPKPRAQSRPRRERSTDKMNGGRRATDASDQQPLPRSRKNSVHTSISAERTPDYDAAQWDLRLPEEIAEDPGEYWVTGGSTGPKGSRIPVAKISPAPIPIDYLERDAPVPRKMSGTVLPDDDFSLLVPKGRSRSGSNPLETTPTIQPTKRSATEGSPRKTTASGARKPSATAAKPATTGRPKTRSGPNKDAGSTARPMTRSGEFSPSSKSAPEGEPPWLINAYKPDPRLPPDQQLLPTVARRLQQEQWEKEGKFGNIYDKDFRPLTDEGFLSPPELQRPQVPETEERQDSEWPLRTDAKSPTPSRPGTSSYSTMPRIQDKATTSPLASPRLPMPQPQQAMQITRVPTAPEQPQMSEKEAKKSGCGCCVVM
ncbi:hypothetical protein BJ170DRAFT_296880 [Xylariales sp. AK1849]|nr:hypothetical protein BJ170DRAFT_296880 [Xylariales sp. AK1849]